MKSVPNDRSRSGEFFPDLPRSEKLVFAKFSLSFRTELASPTLLLGCFAWIIKVLSTFGAPKCTLEPMSPISRVPFWRSKVESSVVGCRGGVVPSPGTGGLVSHV